MGQRGRFGQAGHRGLRGFHGFPGQLAQLAGDDVEGAAARPELGAFDRGIEADEAHIGLDLLHRLDMFEQHLDGALDGRGDLLELAALGFAIAQHGGGAAQLDAQAGQRATGRRRPAIDILAARHDDAGIGGQVLQRRAGFLDIGAEGLAGAGELGRGQARNGGRAAGISSAGTAISAGALPATSSARVGSAASICSMRWRVASPTCSAITALAIRVAIWRETRPVSALPSAEACAVAGDFG